MRKRRRSIFIQNKTQVVKSLKNMGKLVSFLAITSEMALSTSVGVVISDDFISSSTVFALSVIISVISFQQFSISNWFKLVFGYVSCDKNMNCTDRLIRCI